MSTAGKKRAKRTLAKLGEATMTADLARAAIGYARRGLPVLPLWWTDDNSERCSCGGAPRKCRPGKHPVGDLVHHGVTDATLDQRTIANWWRRYPPANVAFATGRDFRLLVVDIDPDAGGEASLAVLEREHGALPASVAVVMPRGGRHLYLIVPAGRPLPTISAGKLGPGLDHRCQGGHVAAPPSAIFGKPYTWAVDSADRFAEAPGWLLDLLARGGGNGQATPPEEWLALVTSGVDEGARNHTIARIAGLLFRRMPEPKLAAELVACFNAAKCRPPLPAEELKRTLDSIADREMKRRGLSS
jgi:Bifunctional DNA primase/polymerase, N-terminal/Primase C terminal 1 (PriCT-1)